MSTAQLDALVALAVSLRPYVVRMLRDRAKLSRHDAEDLAQDTMLAVVVALRDGRVVIAEGVDPLRALRRYVTGIAWHVHQNWRDLYRHRFEVFKPPPSRGHDPLPRHEAASTLRALDLPPVAQAFLSAVVHDGVPAAAQRMGWKHATAGTRLLRIRKDAAAQLRRLRARERH